MTSISHITHIDNLASIIAEGCLWSDAKRIERGLVNQNIGYSHIKQRRLRRPVNVAVGGSIGDYVPFNFCPRSVMLFVIHKGHQDYNGGQGQIVHLLSEVDTVRASNPHCFFTDIHADLDYAEQIDDFNRLGELDIQHISTECNWVDMKEEKQAEFLAFEHVKWHTITRIGVQTPEIATSVTQILAASAHKPALEVQPSWYY
ncbi:MAG: type II toxin-antitoxin system toxin DNA ADP-ribosyl transferase DarT [Cellvibrionaceae bacterium]